MAGRLCLVLPPLAIHVAMTVTETGYDVITFKNTSENSHHVGLPDGRFYGESTGIGNTLMLLLIAHTKFSDFSDQSHYR